MEMVFNSRTQLIIVHSLGIYPKLLILKLCFELYLFKTLKIASLKIKKRICDILRSISDKMVKV